MSVLLTQHRIVVVDAGANVVCGTAVLGVPVLWRVLDLRDTARRPAGVAMVVGGVAMWWASCRPCLPGSERSQTGLVRSSAVVNGIWCGLGALAWRRSRGWPARIVLPVVATYDLAMGIGKLAARDLAG